MDVRLLTSPGDLQLYDFWVRAHPAGSLWQSFEWKRFQEALGREVRIYAAFDGDRIAASALVVIDRTAFGLSTWEIPRGPLVVTGFWLRVSGFLEKIVEDAKHDRALSLFLSPLTDIPRNSRLATHNSRRLVMPSATRILDLTLSDDDLLAQMRPKGRYNIHLAQRHGVRVELSADIDAFAQLMEETMHRDGFRSSGRQTYLRFLETVPGSFLLLAFLPTDLSPEVRLGRTKGEAPAGAEVGAPDMQKTPPGEHQGAAESIQGGQPIAGLLGVLWGSGGLPTDLSSEVRLGRTKGEAPHGAKVGIYYYGASSHAHRDLMAPYLLQWEAMRHCRSQGCTSYDLFGIAPEGNPEHPWAGVSAFKAKFGGSVVTYPPEQEIILRPAMKTVLHLKRRIFG